MERFILDTNLFFNMEAGLNLGQKSEEVVGNLTKKILELRKNQKAEFYMPPRIVDEFLSFFEDKKQDFIQLFLSSIIIKSPDIRKTNLSASVFYELIEDIRLRSYRGLLVAEEEIEQAVKDMLEKDNRNLSKKKDFQIAVGEYKRKLRERYRRATRFGFLDSLADLELILLSQELDANLISTDEGVVNWGRKFGVKEIPAAFFAKHLDSLLHQG
jgi:uncharacterized protein